MSAFFFGSSQHSLFGFYHQPINRPVRPDGVVLCNPMGREYLQVHRSMKQLAHRLSELGHHVLRFDYSGTGDSAGEGADATLSAWRSDVETAAEELKAIAAVDRVSLVGIRMGAALAATVAVDRDDVEDVILWNPVVSGRVYLEELLAGRGTHGASPAPSNGSGVIGVGGFPLGARLREELVGMDLTALEALPVARALVVGSEELEEFRELGDHLATLAPDVTRAHRPGAAGWGNPGRMGNVVLEPAIVNTIVEFMEARP